MSKHFYARIWVAPEGSNKSNQNFGAYYNRQWAIADADHDADAYGPNPHYQGGIFEVWNRTTNKLIHTTKIIAP